MLRGHCTQVLQLRKSHLGEDTYQILIENISNRAMKTNILNALAAYPEDILPLSTAEIVNGQVQWATNYATSTWQQVNTVLLLSREKEALSQLAKGITVEHEIYNDLDTVLLVHRWTVSAAQNQQEKHALKAPEEVRPTTNARTWITLPSGKRQPIGATSAPKRTRPNSPKHPEENPNSPPPTDQQPEPQSSLSPTTPGTTCPTSTSSSWSTAKVRMSALLREFANILDSLPANLPI